MKTIVDVLKGFCESAPERIAITLQHPDQPDIHITYRELVERSNDYAVAYARGGVRPGDLVILILPHGQEIVYSFWGAILHGAIPSIMPFLTEKLAPERYRADMSALFAFSRPSAAVTYPEFAAGCREIASESNSSLQQVFVTTSIPRQETPDFAALAGTSRRSTDTAVIQHSSGSTGLQKGIALSHRAIFNQLDALGAALRLAPEDVIVSWLPLYHDMGLIASFMLPILNGVRVIQMSPFDWVREPWRMLRAISDYHGTLAWMPNFAYNFCARKIRDRHLEGIDLSSWRVCVNGSEPAMLNSHRTFYERFKSYGLRFETLQVGYGMAENVVHATLTTPGEPPYVEEIDRESFAAERVARPASGGRPTLVMMSCGKSIPNTTIRIVDEKGDDLPERHVGEIALKSNCMLNEYYHRPELTAQAFTADGWFKSGDYGYVVNGEVFVAGRKKDLIIVGGKNVYPQDLEVIAGEVPGVRAGRTVAFGLYDEAEGTEIVVICAETDAADPDEQERIANGIRDRVTMNSAIAVRRVQLVPPGWILKTSSGKVARAGNKERFLQEFGADQAGSPPG